MYVYPVDTTVVMKNLQKKVTQLEASIAVNTERGKIRDPELEAAITDAEELRDQLQVGEEKFFRFGLYVTLWADSLEELGFVQRKIETLFGQQMVFSKSLFHCVSHAYAFPHVATYMNNSHFSGQTQNFMKCLPSTPLDNDPFCL